MKGNHQCHVCRKNVDEKVQRRSKRATLCIRRAKESLRQGSAGETMVLYGKIRNGEKVCATCTGYVREKRGSGEVCSNNYRKFQGQSRTTPEISVNFVSLCSDYG